jgi:hypothetical protein
MFLGTPKGQNAFFDIWNLAGKDGEWSRLMLKASDTNLLSQDFLDTARKTMSEDQFEQEFNCSFQASVIGAYYGREMQAAETEGRIGNVAWAPKLPVHTAWDLGIGDSTAIWFAQLLGKEVRLIDYVENSGVGLDWYARELRSRPYVYGEHIWPHDADVTELGSGKSRVETLESLGLIGRVMARRRKEDSINGVRLMLGSCWFDAVKCERGINALRNYRKEWDEKRKVFHDRPLHDWSSHACDAFSELAAAELRPRGHWDKPLDYKHINKGIV